MGSTFMQKLWAALMLRLCIASSTHVKAVNCGQHSSGGTPSRRGTEIVGSTIVEAVGRRQQLSVEARAATHQKASCIKTAIRREHALQPSEDCIH
eukprot:1158786-Pelagomonas_calceolata.AAC.3